MTIQTNQPDAPFALTREEVESALWRRFAGWLEGELAYIRLKNDDVGLGIAETTAKRGEIRLAKRILALADEAGQEARQSEALRPESAFLTEDPPHGG